MCLKANVHSRNGWDLIPFASVPPLDGLLTLMVQGLEADKSTVREAMGDKAVLFTGLKSNTLPKIKNFENY